MKFGYYADRELPEGNYRCPSWNPMPSGKKNVVVLGCSHTYGEGLEDNEHWVHFLSQHWCSVDGLDSRSNCVFERGNTTQS